MKAVNYMEATYTASCQINKIGSVGVVAKINKLYDFYSKRFEPEMIMEFFDGFQQKDGNYWISYKSSIFPMVEFNMELSFEERKTTVNKFLCFSMGCWQLGKILKEHLHFHYNSPPVITLDDFIRDCQRAGIELIFNKETVNKYFN